MTSSRTHLVIAPTLASRSLRVFSPTLLRPALSLGRSTVHEGSCRRRRQRDRVGPIGHRLGGPLGMERSRQRASPRQTMSLRISSMPRTPSGWLCGPRPPPDGIARELARIRPPPVVTTAPDARSISFRSGERSSNESRVFRPTSVISGLPLFDDQRRITRRMVCTVGRTCGVPSAAKRSRRDERSTTTG